MLIGYGAFPKTPGPEACMKMSVRFAAAGILMAATAIHVMKISDPC